MSHHALVAELKGKGSRGKDDCEGVENSCQLCAEVDEEFLKELSDFTALSVDSA
jgi:hypothetical protein